MKKPTADVLVAVHIVTTNAAGLSHLKIPTNDYAKHSATAVVAVAVQVAAEAIQVFYAAGDASGNLDAGSRLLASLADDNHVFVARDVPTQGLLLRELLHVDVKAWLDVESYEKYRQRFNSKPDAVPESTLRLEDLTAPKKFADLAETCARVAARALHVAKQAIADPNLPDWEWAAIVQTCRIQLEGVRVDCREVRDLREYATELCAASQRVLAAAGCDVPPEKDDPSALARLDPHGQEVHHDTLTLPLSMGVRSRPFAVEGTLAEFAENYRGGSRLLQLLPSRLESTPRLFNHLHYYGYLQSGRFTSGGKDTANFNLHGLDKQGLARSARGVIVPPAHKAFVACDSRAIEPRVLAFLADEAALLARFASGDDVYVGFAQFIAPDAPREVGKEAIISLGYGMGQTAFLAKVRRALPEVSQYVVEKAYDTYKATYKCCEALGPTYLSALTDAASSADATEGGHVRFERFGPSSGIEVTVAARLPTGRTLYFKLVRSPGEADLHWLQPGKPEPVELKAHVVKQTIVQAVARDVIVAQGLELEQLGLTVAFSNADELVILAPRCDCDEPLGKHARECRWATARDLVKVGMSRVPTCLPGLAGLPLDAKVNDNVYSQYWA